MNGARFHNWYRLLIVGLCMALYTPPFALLAQELSETEASRGEDGEEVVELERLSVTGTRIKRVDMEGALPVTIINREMIERSGETSVGDLLRNLSFNSFGSYRSQMGTAGMGTAQVDLRGLGAGRTLILVDGRRLPKAPILDEVQDLNMIPLGAVERIEVLTDGASAIYGSDAIGGVINIITRKDYSGWELSYGHAEPHWGKGQRDYGTVLFGRNTAKSSLTVSLAWNDKDISYDREFPSYERTGTFYANNFGSFDPQTGRFTLSSVPGGCGDSAAFYLEPNPNSLTGELCLYDFGLVNSSETSEDTRGFRLDYAHDLNARWTLWLNGSITDNEAFGVYAPVPWFAANWGVWIPETSPNNPTNPDSPMYDPVFGPPAPVTVIHRFSALGNRVTTVENDFEELQAGAKGFVGVAELEFGVRRGWNHTHELQTNLLVPETVVQYVVDGTYDLQHPSQNPAEVTDAMTMEYTYDFDYDQDEVFATATRDWLQTAAGPVGWALGGEYRKEYARFRTTDPTVVSPQSADRSTTSVFLETLVPITSALKLSLAGRYDDYSDWGSEFSPKLSLRWQARKDLVLRASWGEGFRAPQLSVYGMTPDEVAWGSDPQTCAAQGREPGCLVFFIAKTGVSSTLTAETSQQYSAGLVWEPVSWLNLSLDYYHIAMDDEINWFSLPALYELEQLGLSAPPGLDIVRDPVTGELISITRGWGNYDSRETSGIDLNLKLHGNIGPGRWRSDLLYSYGFDYRIEQKRERSPDLFDYPGRPRARGTLSNYYDIGRFGFTWNIHYIADQYDYYLGDVYDEELHGHVPSWVTHDLQVAWEAPWNGRITLGAQNVFNKEPPLFKGDVGNRDYDFSLYDSYGRVMYLEYKQTFQ